MRAAVSTQRCGSCYEHRVRLLVLLTVLLAACGGGSGESIQTNNPPSGPAAAGADTGPLSAAAGVVCGGSARLARMSRRPLI
jgi:hypothetical protein